MVYAIKLWVWFELRKFSVIWESGLWRMSRAHQRKVSKSCWLPSGLDQAFRNHFSSHHHCRNSLELLWQGPRSKLCSLQGTTRNTCNVSEWISDLQGMPGAKATGGTFHLDSAALLFYQLWLELILLTLMQHQPEGQRVAMSLLHTKLKWHSSVSMTKLWNGAEQTFLSLSRNPPLPLPLPWGIRAGIHPQVAVLQWQSQLCHNHAGILQSQTGCKRA